MAEAQDKLSCHSVEFPQLFSKAGEGRKKAFHQHYARGCLQSKVTYYVASGCTYQTSAAFERIG